MINVYFIYAEVVLTEMNASHFVYYEQTTVVYFVVQQKEWKKIMMKAWGTGVQ
jgi:hypothetical protein